MTKQAFIVTGYGYGDEGKGKTTHWLCAKHSAHTVIRFGGPQAMHRIVTSTGQEHVHAQFGSGTLAGAATHLSKHMVIDPYAIIKEGTALTEEFGVNGVFEKLTIHEDALVITPFQAIVNRLRELARGDKKYGSVGVGVGETVLDAEALGEVAIRAKDINGLTLREKLETMRIHKLRILEELDHELGNLSAEARNRAEFEIENLKTRKTVGWAMGWFRKLASMTNIVNTDYVATKILNCPGTVIFEASQGILLDRWHGFHPYTTKVRTIPEPALKIIKECDYNGKITKLGVLRAYHTRHGGGPFVAESAELTKQLPDSDNNSHPWQGNFRVGCFDLIAAKYAVAAGGGQQTIDGMVVTCVDRIKSPGEWQICRTYSKPHETGDELFFSRNASGEITGILFVDKVGKAKLLHQQGLGQRLGKCSPQVSNLQVENGKLDVFTEVLSEELQIPIVALSVGPTEKDCIEISQIKKGHSA